MGDKISSYDREEWQRVVDFHGHVCPGLAQGFRASKAALRALQVPRAEDEELVAIVENDACGVDAVQVLTGCTLGKGNLIFRDYGKQVFIFARRGQEKGIRVYVHGGREAPDPEYLALRNKIDGGVATEEDKERFYRLHYQRIEDLLTRPEEEILVLQEVEVQLPEKARIFASIECAECGEKVAEIRARVKNGKPVCLACAEEYARRW